MDVVERFFEREFFEELAHGAARTRRAPRRRARDTSSGLARRMATPSAPGKLTSSS
jgi:hypothetical protein